MTEEPTSTSSQATNYLRSSMAATRLSFTWFGTRKSLTTQQKAIAADQFDAEVKFVSASKKLLDTQHPIFKEVTAIKGQIIHYWKSLTLPYPEPGIRLIRHEDLEAFQIQMQWFQERLSAAVIQLDEHYEELKRIAGARLGQLYHSADYPYSLRQEFSVTWDFPSVEPPSYLRQLNPRLYAEECQRVQARFTEAVELAESAFMEEFSKLVTHLTERISGSDDGKPKVFRDSALDNLQEFFTRFRKLNIHSNPQLEELILQAEGLIQGVEPQQLRNKTRIRKQIATQLSTVQASLDGLLIDRPRRNLIRKGNPTS
jgi:hypothetical protein